MLHHHFGVQGQFDRGIIKLVLEIFCFFVSVYLNTVKGVLGLLVFSDERRGPAFGSGFISLVVVSCFAIVTDGDTQCRLMGAR